MILCTKLTLLYLQYTNKLKRYLSKCMFRSVFPAVSQHLKLSDKKERNLGYLQPTQPLEKPRFVADNRSCGSRLQAQSRTKGKPNYLLQEARNEEALARLDMNLLVSAAPVPEQAGGCNGTLGVRFMGENWGGNVRHNSQPADTNPRPTPVTFMPTPTCQNSNTFAAHA